MQQDRAAVSAADLDIEVQQAIALCDGDAIAALRATLFANAFLEVELERLKTSVSTGYSRSKVRKPGKGARIRKQDLMRGPAF
jgi:hypothetical protein